MFVANFPNRPAELDPNSAQFINPSYTVVSVAESVAPIERNASDNVLATTTPCVSRTSQKRCVGNLAQTCQAANGAMFFRTAQDCNSTSVGGNFVQMCRRSTGQCCAPGLGNSGNCQ